MTSTSTFKSKTAAKGGRAECAKKQGPGTPAIMYILSAPCYLSRSCISVQPQPIPAIRDDPISPCSPPHTSRSGLPAIPASVRRLYRRSWWPSGVARRGSGEIAQFDTHACHAIPDLGSLKSPVWFSALHAPCQTSHLIPPPQPRRAPRVVGTPV